MMLAAIALAGILGAGIHPGAPADVHASAAQSATTSFSWVGAYYAATTPGASAVLPQADPTLATPAGAGHSRFAATLEEHERNVAAYRHGLKAAQGSH